MGCRKQFNSCGCGNNNRPNQGGNDVANVQNCPRRLRRCNEELEEAVEALEEIRDIADDFLDDDNECNHHGHRGHDGCNNFFERDWSQIEGTNHCGCNSCGNYWGR